MSCANVQLLKRLIEILNRLYCTGIVFLGLGFKV